MRFYLYLCFLFITNISFGQWVPDSLTNNPVCVATGSQTNVQVASDGAGGAAIVWQDNRNGNIDIYMQVMTAAGNAAWAPDGIAVCTFTGSQSIPQIINAGNGNYIVTWQDNRNGSNTDDIYAQLITADGTPQWTADGVAICSATGRQSLPKIISDASGGAIIVWQDPRNGTFDIYAQRIAGNGSISWAADGIAVCDEADAQVGPQIISDDNGGAIITWYDNRSATYDIYAQRIDASGAKVWSASDGILICGEDDIQQSPKLCTDNNHGAIISWVDIRSGINADIYAQWVDQNGTTQWATDGVPISTAAFDQVNQQIISDGSGGAFLTWEDTRSGLDENELPKVDIYAQKIAADGNVAWVTNGMPVCMEAGNQITPQLISDENGGIIITWSDGRVGLANDIYAQRLNSTGDAQWAANGTAVSSADGNQFAPQLVKSTGGAIIAWYDGRISIPLDYNIYASNLSSLGTLPVTALKLYGKCETTGDILYWTTATEQNNRGFDIERSADGRHFNNIGFVEGKGNSTVEQAYNFTDKFPLSGKNYYRLKQTDLDGRFTYSIIIMLQPGNGADQISLYPNPAKDNVSVRIQLNRNEKLEWQVIDTKGRSLKQGNWQVLNGSNQLSSINVINLPAGVYYVSIKGTSVQKLIKIIKQ
ncbi:MAG: T9SS type A sorting domain-containing protein [Agriterribacter sp.]